MTIARTILSAPGRKPILHKGFKVYENTSNRRHAWMRCAEGVLAIMTRAPDDGLLMLEDDVMLHPKFGERVDRGLALIAGIDPKVLCYYCANAVGMPVTDAPYPLPEGVHDWGTQAVLYNTTALGICIKLIEAYISQEVALTPNDYRVQDKPISGGPGVMDGYDVFMYRALRNLNVPVLYWASVQHMCAPSLCLSSQHTSPYCPTPDWIRESGKKEGWW